MSELGNWLHDERLRFLLEESLRIEDILRPPSEDEFKMAKFFLRGSDVPTIQDLICAVKVFQPNAQYRGDPSVHGVRVGKHVAPKSGFPVQNMLERLYYQLRAHQNLTAHSVYCDYEYIHPFTDGNGRSGRLLWLWVKIHREKDYSMDHLGFLERFHYDTLAAHHGS